MSPLLAALLLAVVPARALPNFEGSLEEIRAAAFPSVEKMLGELKESSDPKRQLALLDDIRLAAGRMTSEEQGLVVGAFEELALSTAADSEVRGATLETLGKSAAFFSDYQQAKNAILVLSDAITREDSEEPMTALRYFALKGLKWVAGSLPSADPDLEKTVVSSILYVFEKSTWDNERTYAYICLHDYLRKSGAYVLYRESGVMEKFQASYLSPLKNDLGLFYKAHDAATRLLVMNSLNYVAAYAGGVDVARLRPDICLIFTAMQERERDTYLQKLAHDSAQAVCP